MIILKREKEQMEQILENQKEMLIESQRINQMLLVMKGLNCRKNIEKLRISFIQISL